MTLLWRPEGWDNPYTIDKDYESGLQGVAYEAGADAMLKALAPHLSSFFVIGEQIKKAMENKE